MKTFNHSFLLFLFLSFAIGSCKKDLSLDPADFIAQELYYQTPAELQTALNGVYSALSSQAVYGMTGNNLMYQWESVDEQTNLTGSTGVPQKYDYNSSFAGVADIWRSLYAGIERANILLENINKPEMPDADRKLVEGQARFLRAYYYFMLVSNSGAVPLKTESTKSVIETAMARTPADQVYDWIIKEMEASEPLVAPITAYTHAGRVTKSAVQGILARVCLYKAGFPYNDVAKYADVAKWCKKVMDNPHHDLIPDYRQVFINYIQDKYDTRESIWEVEFYNTGVGDFFLRYGGWGATNGIRQQDATLGFSNGGMQAHVTLFNRFEPNDYRRDWTIAPFQYVDTTTAAGTTDRGTTKMYWRPDQIFDRRVGKWRREYELQANKINNFTGTNFCILRFSDVLLMAAEAENYLNGPANAYALVNRVRQRGYGKSINGETLKSITITNGGSGYTANTNKKLDNVTVSITGGGATQNAKAVAFVTNGAITSVSIADPGKFYTSNPAISFSGVTGKGAIATATISKADDYLLQPSQYATKDAMLKTIQDERSRELALEGTRRYDLIRWGILVPTIQTLGDYLSSTAAPTNIRPFGVIGTNVEYKHNYIPIPSAELSLNPLLVQTDGWQ